MVFAEQVVSSERVVWSQSAASTVVRVAASGGSITSNETVVEVAGPVACATIVSNNVITRSRACARVCVSGVTHVCGVCGMLLLIMMIVVMQLVMHASVMQLMMCDKFIGCLFVIVLDNCVW